jgi:hypothetical protein
MPFLLRLKRNWEYNQIFFVLTPCGLSNPLARLSCGLARQLFHHQITTSDIVAVESAKNFKSTVIMEFS